MNRHTFELMFLVVLVGVLIVALLLACVRLMELRRERDQLRRLCQLHRQRAENYRECNQALTRQIITDAFVIEGLTREPAAEEPPELIH